MKIKKNIIPFATLLLITFSALMFQSCRSKNSTNNQSKIVFPIDNYDSDPSPSRDFVGARLLSTNKGFKIPESATLDTRNNYLYVSNINGEPDVKDSSGYITRVMLSGEIIDTLPIAHLNAPKGMTVAGNALYIAEIDRIVVYNLESQTIAKIYQPQGAEFLNDITSDADNNVYISDTKAGCVFKISQQGELQKFFADSLCTEVNGLCRADAKIAMASANRIITIDPLNARRRIFANLHFTPDGLKYHNDTTFIASDFLGNIFAVTPKECRLLVNAREGVNAADFEYLPQQNILIVPTFFNNSIDIYEISLD